MIPQAFERSKGQYSISTDKIKIQVPVVHHFLADSYWAKKISEEQVRRSIENSLCFSVYEHEKQIGFARVISDYTTFAYLADVFIIEEYRNKGLSKWLMECIVNHPDLQGLRRWVLATRDAHGLYAQYGFTPLSIPERWMELHNPGVYSSPKNNLQ